MGTSSINGSFSMAMLNNQRGTINIPYMDPIWVLTHLQLDSALSQVEPQKRNIFPSG